MKALSARFAHTPEPDGATLHCVHISQICFKIGRVTVPPTIVLASNGFSSPPSPPPPPASSGTKIQANKVVPYSHANPPPHWARVKALRCKPEGSMKAYVEFLKGGWRDVPEGERWWEEALAGPVEERRRAQMRALDWMRNGMEMVARSPE
jgi:hypothetical protein